MYSSIETLLSKISRQELIDYVNDENRLDSEIDLTDEKDFCTKRINDAIKDASNEMDGYMENKYELPFEKTPERLIPISDDISIYYLAKRRYRNNMPESVVNDYKMRIKDMERIREGKFSLGIVTPENKSSMSGEVLVSKKSKDRIFNDEAWRKY